MGIHLRWILSVALLILSGCAGMNPNPGERTADTNWEMGNYLVSLDVVRPRAERGEPWAQLRIGIYYETGYGVAKNIDEAISWYKKAAVQMTEGKWAEGYIVGALGKAGYFGQNNDALIAQYRLADIYFKGQGVARDIIKAFLLINNVSKLSNGENIFFCCSWSGGRWFTAEMISKMKSDIKGDMTEEEIKRAKNLSVSWSPEMGL